MEEEKELYWKLEDNGDMSCYCQTLEQATDIMSTDILDVAPHEREEVFYTLTPVYMTQTEYEALPDE